MPAKKTKTRVLKSKISKKASVPKWLLLTVLLVFVAIGVFFIYKSFAATTATSWERDLRWYSSSSTQFSSNIRSTDGWLCAGTMFSNDPSQEYRFIVDWWNGRAWQAVRNSKTYRANGNVDQACFDRNISQNGTYRVRFAPFDSTSMGGWAWVYGRNTNPQRSSVEFESPENN